MTDLRITITGVISTAALEMLLEQYPGLTLDDVSMPHVRVAEELAREYPSI